MSDFKFDNKTLTLHISNLEEDKCYQYAVSELRRLFKRVDIETTLVVDDERTFQLGVDSLRKNVQSAGEDRAPDSFVIDIEKDNIQLAADSAKGILNAVYDLMEQAGFTYLLPGEDGEWPPEDGLLHLPLGRQTHVPRFPYRGVFAQPKTNDYPHDDWLRFYAKLKFNAISCRGGDLALCETLGIRLEIGGHGFSHLLPRELFDEKPELFRMFQPEDFNGRRMSDSNICVTNTETREIVKENFREDLAKAAGAYAIHAWADDLPAGGWCLCPTCRSFSPEDQSMLAMRLLAEVCEEEDSGVRIPVIAYHDTMCPGKNIEPAKENFLLFAPRERCYGHALDDENCERNKFYCDALRQWRETFDGIDDSHTFEYYFDQVLFRGMYPFLPQIIIDDMKIYRQHDIKTHLSLQVAGPELSPEYNMLIFARAHWNEGLDANQFCRHIAKKIAAEHADSWYDYLMERGRIFTEAMRMCDYDVTVYLDYRWLPENTSEFGKTMADVYQKASAKLHQAAEKLKSSITAECPKRLVNLAETESKRAMFEAAELQAMHYQQKALNEFAAYLNSNDKRHAERGCGHLSQAIDAMAVSKKKAQEFGLPETCWYFGNINKWQTNEFKKKQANYQSLLSKEK